MQLHSERQPQLRKLVCQQVDNAGLGWHVTFDEMRLTLSPLGGFIGADGSDFPPAEESPY